jgi:hypothetical protein
MAEVLDILDMVVRQVKRTKSLDVPQNRGYFCKLVLADVQVLKSTAPEFGRIHFTKLS